jgi:sRNA-binding regulator protein Hfq
MINISQLRMKRAKKEKEELLREFEDYYEYCFIKDYEMRYDDFMAQAIQIQDIFINLLELKGKTTMVSIMFPKSYNLHEIVEWLDSYTVSFNEKDAYGYFISNAHEIEDSMLFKGNPIVLASRGQEKIYFETKNLIEITDQYKNYHEIVNTVLAKDVDLFNSPLRQRLFLNNEEITEVPRIDFDLSRDEIYVNGVFIAADYMDEYCNGLAIYREADSLLPIVFFVGEEDISISLEELEDGSKICRIYQKVH